MSIDNYLANFKIKKKWGQHFLIDQNIINKIIALAKIDDYTLIIEIGVGLGTLTTALAKQKGQVIGYEIDKELFQIAGRVLKDYDNVSLINADFLKVDLKRDLAKYHYSEIYVIANLPYYITTPIINKIIKSNIKLSKMIIMVQKEIGDRFKAKPKSRAYNSLTVYLNYYFDIKELFKVSKNVFIPIPKVDSAVFEMTSKNKVHLLDEQLFFKLVKDAFQFKRKILKNNLKDYDLNVISSILNRYNLDLTVRAEHLTLQQFIEIANALKLS